MDSREFTGYLTRISRPAPMPVAGHDLTLSPVKSVAALWAVAPRELAATIAACHDDAVRDTIGWLEQHAVYTRRGTNGVAWCRRDGADRSPACDPHRSPAAFPSARCRRFC
ncbi:MAG: relaxase domain-containing protein [Actinobacteria bacterium]|nr:relaxase domain-containing protein [Actinomycetota bacterium]